MNARHADANPIFVAARSAAPGYIRLMLAALAVSILLAAASPSPATAQSTRVTALPASDVLSLRVVGDTIARRHGHIGVRKHERRSHVAQLVTPVVCGERDRHRARSQPPAVRGHLR